MVAVSLWLRAWTRNVLPSYIDSETVSHQLPRIRRTSTEGTMPDATPSRHRLRALRAWAGAAVFAACVVGLAALSLDAMRARAAAEAAEALPPAPLPVRVTPLAILDGYAIPERFVGRIEPARSAALAFERPGLVAEILADEGEPVAAGAVIARLDVAALGHERARLDAASAALAADLALADNTLARRQALSGRGFDSAQSLDEARFAVAALRARLLQTEAELAQVALDVEKSTLRAPFAGVLSARRLDEGAVVAAGAELATLQETARPQARIGAPADIAAGLATGDALAVQTRRGAVEGVLRAVSPDVDPATRTRSLLLDLPDDAPLAMGELVRLVLSRPVEDRGAWVPLGALQEGGRGLWAVYLAAPDGQGGHVARREAVEALHVEEGRVFVRGAFADGALLVTEGVNRLTHGQRVAPLAPAEG
jgi:RND family efflux transporter MFP subunit